jgi:dTDP-4-dehydrorhamnose reductase
MRIAVTGANGILGRAVCRRLAQRCDVVPLDIEDADITDRAAIRSVIQATDPDAVVHCAAFTDVDGSESQGDIAHRVNALGTRNTALACAAAGSSMLYLSTDYVFDGEKGQPYDEFDPPHPLNLYGRSKLAGEICVRSLLPAHYIVRTSWLYGSGGRNFVTAILSQADRGRPLRVVDDQIGSPTYAVDLAEAIEVILGSEAFGTYHVTNAGECSWRQFAIAILEHAGIGGVDVLPITTAEANRPAARPAYSVLRNFIFQETFGFSLRPWTAALGAYLLEVKARGGRDE